VEFHIKFAAEYGNYVRQYDSILGNITSASVAGTSVVIATLLFVLKETSGFYLHISLICISSFINHFNSYISTVMLHILEKRERNFIYYKAALKKLESMGISDEFEFIAKSDSEVEPSINFDNSDSSGNFLSKFFLLGNKISKSIRPWGDLFSFYHTISIYVMIYGFIGLMIDLILYICRI